MVFYSLFLLSFFAALRQFFFTWNFLHKSTPPGEASDWIKELPSSGNIRQLFHTYASKSHLAGTDADQALAHYTRDKLIEYGITDTQIETYYPLLNYPTQRWVALLNKDGLPLYEARLEEDVILEDKESQPEGRPATFHGYSADGNVTGPVIFAHYGRRQDFEWLVAKGINLTGTVALLRNGGAISSGVKIRLAEGYGCHGVLLYSDPLDDGPINKGVPGGEPAKSYPHGPWRSRMSVKRDTVHAMTRMVGDPLTPGYAALENVTRLYINETGFALPGIPSLPISWSDAVPLLRATEGHGYNPGAEWQGGLCNVSYHSGPSLAQVNLVNKNRWDIKPIWNVLGKIPGQIEPNATVIIGTHRDAWGYGAVDGSSGSAVLVELARTLGVLLQRGWRPRRTLLLASWDAEKYGAVGSTEWVEAHKDWLGTHAVAYLHVDRVAGPHFEAEASPLLHQLLYKVTQDVYDPKTSKTIYDVWKQQHPPTRLPGQVENISPPLVDPLRSNSDPVAFFEHVGISSLAIKLDGDFGVSHSNHDSIHWMETFGDPTFEYHATMVRLWGLMALHLSCDAILPMYPLDYAAELLRYEWHMRGQYDSQTLPALSEAIKALHSASARFDAKAERYRRQVAVRKHTSHKLKRHIQSTNDRLVRFERAFIDPLGLPGRNWFRHVIYAPDAESGHEPQLFPGIADALASHDHNYIREMEDRTALVIDTARRVLEGIFYDISDE